MHFPAKYLQNAKKKSIFAPNDNYTMKTEHIILSDNSGSQTAPTVSVAVHLHLFYPDLIPVFLTHLAYIPVPFSLFVSLPENIHANEDEVIKSFSSLPRLRDTKVKRTPNRGRDIAPMLCSFAEELQGFDVMLHLHTKKSPQASDQSEWLHMILAHLLPDEQRVAGILQALTHGVGMMTPPDFIRHTTLGGWGVKENLLIAQQLVDQNGLDINLQEKYPEIDYPQGGMFWARTEYLSKFFSQHLTYNDFPKEPIGIDGTIAHALERLYFLWGCRSGLKVCRIYLSEMEELGDRRFTFEFSGSLQRERQYYQERLYFEEKNKKHLRLCRYLSVACLMLLVLLLISLFT